MKAYITAILAVGIDEEVPETEQDYILKTSEERSQQLIDEVFGTAEEE